MAASISAHKNKSPQRQAKFSLSETEAAKLLIQLSSGDSESERDRDRHSSSSYSVVQGKPHHGKVDSGNGDVSSIAATAEVGSSESEDESFARSNKRYRYIEDLYRVTTPVPAAVKAKTMVKGRK